MSFWVTSEPDLAQLISADVRNPDTTLKDGAA